jgi:predicted DNA-binding transcriptional regulator AlpA
MTQKELNSSTDLLRIEQVSQITSLSKSCIRLWVAKGLFPRPLNLSRTLKPFVGEEIRQWIRDRSSEGR